jgi:DNA-directed RNA polymerase specialized sigma24 family protein
MGPADWKRAEQIADWRAHGLHGPSGEDLLQEACVQLLSLQRRFPRGKQPLVVLKNAIRSCASNIRKSAAERLRDGTVTIQPEYDPEFAEGFDEMRPIAPGAVDHRTPEVELLAKQELDAHFASLEGDPEAELVMLAWADGLRGAKAIEATGLSSKDFDAARNRLLRKHKALSTRGDN